MTKVWGTVREFLPMAAIILLCMLFMPVAQAHAENNGTGTSNGTANGTAVSTQQTTATVSSDQKTVAPAAKAKVAATKPRDKSVLDAEVLESPLDYFRNAFGSEEEEADAARAGAVIITVKALVATLLSTVM
ncbi:hypothetical protein [Pontibacter akesuensis]|uniref:Uncharacterized protein n=1 Tax=Pontibacter akesuensis TaxID=388950 RepID=A0A1I7I4M3_9BACT|nr:hypothetical protein [Pontibacter akesuensis]SFU67897.1 hypothetical protein SAMN04487941_1912 [Pontibacter akesuensis]